MLNFLSLAQQIKDEKDAIVYFQSYEILHESRKCKNKHEMYLQVSEKHIRWVCKRRGCRLNKGVRINTWFNGKKIVLICHILFFSFFLFK